MAAGRGNAGASPEWHLDGRSISARDLFFLAHETLAIAFNGRGNADARVPSTQLPNFHSKEEIQ